MDSVTQAKNKNVSDFQYSGKLKDTAKMVIRVDSDSTPIIQEMHIAIGHIVSNIVEDLVSNEQAV